MRFLNLLWANSLASLNLPDVPGICNDSDVHFSIHLKDEFSIPYTFFNLLMAIERFLRQSPTFPQYGGLSTSKTQTEHWNATVYKLEISQKGEDSEPLLKSYPVIFVIFLNIIWSHWSLLKTKELQMFYIFLIIHHFTILFFWAIMRLC